MSKTFEFKNDGSLRNQFPSASHYYPLSVSDKVLVGEGFRWYNPNPDKVHRRWVRQVSRQEILLAISTSWGSEMYADTPYNYVVCSPASGGEPNISFSEFHQRIENGEPVVSVVADATDTWIVDGVIFHETHGLSFNGKPPFVSNPPQKWQFENWLEEYIFNTGRYFPCYKVAGVWARQVKEGESVLVTTLEHRVAQEKDGLLRAELLDVGSWVCIGIRGEPYPIYNSKKFEDRYDIHNPLMKKK